MAEYTNLASLEGLQVGDIVTYTSTTAFDAKGYKFKVELYGKKVSSVNGGYTQFTIDTSLTPETILSFNSRGDLIYGDTTDVYYRIGVAGDAGKMGTANSGFASYTQGTGGLGGGTTAGTGTKTVVIGMINVAPGSGGTQTSGSSFGGTTNYGWYSGYTGSYNSSMSVYGGSGGGSGFIIGTSTTTYPAGYLGNDTTLQTTIASAISDGTLTRGGSTYTAPRMVMTILELPPSEGGESLSTLKYYNGTEFINTNAKYYNGSELVNCNVYYFDGTELKKI